MPSSHRKRVERAVCGRRHTSHLAAQVEQVAELRVRCHVRRHRGVVPSDRRGRAAQRAEVGLLAVVPQEGAGARGRPVHVVDHDLVRLVGRHGERAGRPIGAGHLGHAVVGRPRHRPHDLRLLVVVRPDDTPVGGELPREEAGRVGRRERHHGLRARRRPHHHLRAVGRASGQQHLAPVVDVHGQRPGDEGRRAVAPHEGPRRGVGRAGLVDPDDVARLVEPRRVSRPSGDQVDRGAVPQHGAAPGVRAGHRHGPGDLPPGVGVDREHALTVEALENLDLDRRCRGRDRGRGPAPAGPDRDGDHQSRRPPPCDPCPRASRPHCTSHATPPPARPRRGSMERASR